MEIEVRGDNEELRRKKEKGRQGKRVKERRSDHNRTSVLGNWPGRDCCRVSQSLHSISRTCSIRCWSSLYILPVKTSFTLRKNSKNWSCFVTFGTQLHCVWCAPVSIVLGVLKLVGGVGKGWSCLAWR